jgi:hypothetical protein
MKSLQVVSAVVVLLFCFAACSQPDKAWRTRLVHIDSVAINMFPGNGSMDSVLGVTVIRDKGTIDSICRWVTEAQADKPSTPCGPQASLHFFSRGMVMHDAELGTAACGVLNYRFQGKVHYTRIPQPFAQWLDIQRQLVKR